MSSLTSVRPRRTAVAAIHRSPVCTFWWSGWPACSLASRNRLADMQVSVSDHAVKLFTLQQRRIAIESIAYIRPVIVRREEQLLMVPPRAFLCGGQ